MILIRIWLTFAVLIAMSPLAFAAEAQKVPARQPLTYKDSGIYGWWQPYFWEGPYDFIITQAIILPGDFGTGKVTNNCSDLPHIKEWNESLLKARAAGKRVLVVVSPGQGQPYAEPYYQALEQFLANINHEELYAITLGEENISSPDWIAALGDFYHRIKKKYPELPVYQWYTCSSRSTTRPGFIWPLLPSDGWMSDEYVSTPDDFEQCVRRYRMLGLPYINIIWASPFYSSSRETSVPFHQSIFDSHVRVSQKYDVPTAYFCWDGPANGRNFPWDEKGHPENKELYKVILENISKADSIPAEALRDWDTGDKPAVTNLAKRDDGPYVYRESYDLWIANTDFKPADPDFMERSGIRGLRHLKWKSDPSRIVAVSDDNAKPIDASITNHWAASDGQPCKMTASASVKIEPGSKPEIIFEASSNGYDWVARTTSIQDGVMTIELPEPAAAVYTRLRISGTSDKAGQPLASIDWIEVRGGLAK